MQATARIAKGDLRGLDSLEVDALVLPLFELLRQPSSVAGFADWRLAGRIGRLLLKRRFKGELGEVLLMPSLGRLGAERIFLFGLGAPAELNDADAQLRAKRMVDVLAGAGSRVFAIAPPELPLEVSLASPVGEGRDVRKDSSKPGSFSMSSGARLLAQCLEASEAASPKFERVVLLDVDGSLARAEVHLAVAARRGGLTWQS